MDECGPDDAEVRRRQDRIFRISRISRVDLAALIVVVADMVFRPGS